jgi:uncharacterized protein DUF6012
MLLHIRPRLLSPFKIVSLIDLRIEPLGIHLLGGTDLTTGRPYPNKFYAVACRKQGRKALDGILIETEKFVDQFSYTARWAVEAELGVTHQVDYKILDRDFDAASDSMMLWHRCCTELGGWSNRFPSGSETTIPMTTEPMMEIDPRCFDNRRSCEDTIEGGWIVSRREVFYMPTIEPERILQTKLAERMPTIDMAFKLG